MFNVISPFLYRRPENPNAADTCEKIGCWLLTGLDGFNKKVVTYYNQEIITPYQEQDGALMSGIKRISAFVKIIFIPLAIFGFAALWFSNSYNQLRANIVAHGIVEPAEFNQAMWNRLHGRNEAYDPTRLKDNETIWDYIKRVQIDAYANFGYSRDNISIDRETAGVVIKHSPLRNLPLDKDALYLPQFKTESERKHQSYLAQFGTLKPLLCEVTSRKSIRSEMKQKVNNKPYEVFICYLPDVSNTNTLFLVYKDAKGHVAKKDFAFENLEQLLSKVSETRNLTFYEVAMNRVKTEMQEVFDEMNDILPEIEDLKITKDLERLEYVVTVGRENSPQLTKRFDWNVKKPNLNKFITNARARLNEISDRKNQDINSAEMVNPNFVSVNFNVSKMRNDCATQSIIQALHQLDKVLTEQLQKPQERLHYKLLLGNLYHAVRDYPGENWTLLAAILKNENFNFDTLKNFLGKIRGMDVEEILYFLYQRKETNDVENRKEKSFTELLILERNKAIDQFIEEQAQLKGVSENIIRKALVNFGVGINYPPIRRKDGASLSDEESTILYNELLQWLPLHMKFSKIKEKPSSISGPVTQVCQHIIDSPNEPYQHQIDLAKIELIGKNRDDFEFQIFSHRFTQEKNAILNRKNQALLDEHIDPRVIEIVTKLNGDIENLESKYPNRLTNHEQANAYIEAKKRLKYAALDEHHQMMHDDREGVLSGDLPGSYFTSLHKKIMEDKGFTTDGFVNENFIRAYISVYN